MRGGERFFSHMEARRINWHNWSTPTQPPLSEDEALHTQMDIIMHFKSTKNEMVLFVQEGVTRSDYLGKTHKPRK